MVFDNSYSIPFLINFRIMSLGGSVATVNGVSRVVWKRPIASTRADKELNRSPKFEYIPFLAVSRALGTY